MFRRLFFLLFWFLLAGRDSEELGWIACIEAGYSNYWANESLIVRLFMWVLPHGPLSLLIAAMVHPIPRGLGDESLTL